jgi:PleD family two-component response regulator
MNPRGGLLYAASVGTVVAFPRIQNNPEKRQGPDRRRKPRGGRRTSDQNGFAPLVLLVDEDVDNGARCEAILAKLRFAVAPAQTVEEALRVMEALKPNLIVARVSDAEPLRLCAPPGVPILVLTDDLDEPEAMVDGIRQTLRSSPAH